MQDMKRRVLMVLLSLMVGIAATSQESDGQEKYLKAGAVPVVEGKVVFSDSVSIVQGYSSQQVNAIARSWIDGYLKENKGPKNRVVTDADGRIDAMAQIEIVFTKNSFSYDRAMMNFVVSLNTSADKCQLTISRISYNYNDGTDMELIMAEDYITDANAVNKKGTRLFPITGKFRRKTIDAVDDIFSSFRDAMKFYSKEGMAEIVSKAPHVMAAQGHPAAQMVQAPYEVQTHPQVQPQTVPAHQAQNRTMAEKHSGTTGIEGFRKISPEELSGNIIKMISQEWMLITAGNGEKANMMTASWGGVGVLYNKPVAICFINPARYTYSIMEKNDTYTLTFYPGEYKDVLQYCGTKSGRDEDKIKGSGLTPLYTENGAVAFSQACIIIECRKLLSQSLMLDAIEDETERNKRAMQPMHKMYIGEILNVWVK